jgi:hypothetical protein
VVKPKITDIVGDSATDGEMVTKKPDRYTRVDELADVYVIELASSSSG